MKKLVSLALCAFSAFALLGATLQTVTDPKPGELGLKASGRIAAVDVFSTVQDGTVEISRVFSAPFYTNAVDTTSTVVTNIVRKDFFTYDYRIGGNVYTNLHVAEGAYWDAYHFDGDANDLKFIKEPIGDYPSSGWSYGGEFVPSTDRYAVYIDFQNHGIAFDRKDTLDHSTFTTNIVTVVTTNSVTPVKAYDLTITNAIFSGSCEGNCFHGVPSPDVWVFPGDKILFGGTATGGALRLVIE